MGLQHVLKHMAHARCWGDDGYHMRLALDGGCCCHLDSFSSGSMLGVGSRVVNCLPSSCGWHALRAPSDCVAFEIRGEGVIYLSHGVTRDFKSESRLDGTDGPN